MLNKNTEWQRQILPILCGIVPYGPSETPVGHTFTLKEHDEQAAYRKKIKERAVKRPFSAPLFDCLY